MVDEQLTATVLVKECSACSSGLLERDKFCRWCGSPQTYSLSPVADCQDRVSREQVAQERMSSVSLSLSPYTTSALSHAAVDDRPYRRVSGPLVKALVAGVSGRRSIEPSGRVSRSLVQALVSIPIWLMIVLLSPLDAYVAAKAISREF
jgi:hypothetical protein